MFEFFRRTSLGTFFLKTFYINTHVSESMQNVIIEHYFPTQKRIFRRQWNKFLGNKSSSCRFFSSSTKLFISHRKIERLSVSCCLEWQIRSKSVLSVENLLYSIFSSFEAIPTHVLVSIEMRNVNRNNCEIYFQLLRGHSNRTKVI